MFSKIERAFPLKHDATAQTNTTAQVKSFHRLARAIKPNYEKNSCRGTKPSKISGFNLKPSSADAPLYDAQCFRIDFVQISTIEKT